MPPPQSDDWRTRIPKAVVDIVSREGIEAATVRRIAAEVGHSTAVVTHYFRGKNDLLIAAYRGSIGEKADRRFNRVVARDRADVVGYLMSMIGLAQHDLAEWRFYVAIWNKSLQDQQFAEELLAWADRGVERIEMFIHAYNPDYLETNNVAKQLLALVQGISVQLIFDRDSWSEEEVRSSLDRQVRLLLGERSQVSDTVETS